MVDADRVSRQVTTVGLSVTLSCNAEAPEQAAVSTLVVQHATGAANCRGG